jgi:holo-[acyl-carrier protein] synthase
VSVLAVGIDVVEVSRARHLLGKQGARVYTRLLTRDEAKYCKAQREPAPHVAARLAVKEAAYKALQGTAAARGIGWRDIELVRGRDGTPSLKLHNLAAKRAEGMGASRVLVSLSHTHDTAAAVVILTDE